LVADYPRPTFAPEHRLASLAGVNVITAWHAKRLFWMGTSQAV